MLLVDWFPRKVVADTRYLAGLPNLLRAFIAYCHDHEGIGAGLTAETLTSVDRWEGEYQRMIRSDRPQGAAVLAAQLLKESYVGFDGGDLGMGAFILEGLAAAVGVSQRAEPLYAPTGLTRMPITANRCSAQWTC